MISSCRLTSFNWSSPSPESSAVRKAVLSCMMSCRLIRSLAFCFLKKAQTGATHVIQKFPVKLDAYSLCDKVKDLVGGRLVVGNLLLLLDLLLCQFLLFEVFLFDGCKSNEYAFSLDHQQSNSEDSVLVCLMRPLHHVTYPWILQTQPFRSHSCSSLRVSSNLKMSTL